MMVRATLIFALLAAAVWPFDGLRPASAAHALSRPDAYTLVGSRGFFAGIPTRAPGGRVRVVIEMPAGTCEKWSVQASDGSLRRRIENGLPRSYVYLPLPANLGSIPRTWSVGAKEEPLDALVLGPSLERGTVATARVIGVLRLEEEGVRDDKLIAVPTDGPFSSVVDLAGLSASFPGALDVLASWFENACGAASLGVGDAREAKRWIDAGCRAFQEYALGRGRRAGGRSRGWLAALVDRAPERRRASRWPPP